MSGLACAGPLGPSYPITTPPEAVVPLSLPTVAKLTPEERDLWARHLRSSLAWEVRQVRDCTFGVRVQPQARPDGTVAWETAMNGFYFDFQAKDGVYQTRVITGLGCTHGFGTDRGQITRAAATDPSVQLKLEDYMDQPGLNSALIVSSDSGLTVEVFEQGDPQARPFTRRALAEVEAELASVLKHRQELLAQGVVPALVPDGSTTTGTPSLVVEDDGQPGLYRLTAWVNPGKPGHVEARAFFVGPVPDHPAPTEVGAPGTELSADRLRGGAIRRTGWGPDADRLFRYQSGVTIYEGDWGQPYLARFELWHVAPDGAETKLVEHTRPIEGWMR